MKDLDSAYNLLRDAITAIQGAQGVLAALAGVDNPQPPDPNAPIMITLPGAPPTERRVETAAGQVFIREISADDGYNYGPWGSWRLEGDPLPFRCTWLELLAKGPLTLIPLTAEEKANALLYGPPGARWGTPLRPCPYALGDVFCTLGFGHTGPHLDGAGAPIGMTEVDNAMKPITAAVTRDDYNLPCTCGHPEHHKIGCNRYSRTAGPGDPDEKD